MFRPIPIFGAESRADGRERWRRRDKILNKSSSSISGHLSNSNMILWWTVSQKTAMKVLVMRVVFFLMAERVKKGCQEHQILLMADQLQEKIQSHRVHRYRKDEGDEGRREDERRRVKPVKVSRGVISSYLPLSPPPAEAAPRPPPAPLPLADILKR
jgi:hypothetical protein